VTTYDDPMFGIQRIVRGVPRLSVLAGFVAWGSVGLGCGSAQPTVAEPVEPDVEVAILYACSLEFVQTLDAPIAGADAGLGSLATQWGEDASGDRVRVIAQVYVHPRYGPGGEFDVQRERWDGTSETWGRVAATSEDRALSSAMSESVRDCWMSRTRERVPGRHS